jgi:hypothetical protein
LKWVIAPCGAIMIAILAIRKKTALARKGTN